MRFELRNWCLHPFVITLSCFHMLRSINLLHPDQVSQPMSSGVMTIRPPTFLLPASAGVATGFPNDINLVRPLRLLDWTPAQGSFRSDSSLSPANMPPMPSHIALYLRCHPSSLVHPAFYQLQAHVTTSMGLFFGRLNHCIRATQTSVELNNDDDSANDNLVLFPVRFIFPACIDLTAPLRQRANLLSFCAALEPRRTETSFLCFVAAGSIGRDVSFYPLAFRSLVTPSYLFGSLWATNSRRSPPNKCGWVCF